MVPNEVVAVTVMRVLLFVLHVCLLRECDGVTAPLLVGCVVCSASILQTFQDL